MSAKTAPASSLICSLLLAATVSIPGSATAGQEGLRSQAPVKSTTVAKPEIRRPSTSPLPEHLPNQGSACDPNG